MTAAAPRDRRELVPFEVAAVILIAFLPMPTPIPRVVPLLVVATISRWLRRTSWEATIHGGSFYALVGAAAGFVALGIALVAGTPLVESLTEHAVEWSTFPIVRGSSSQLFVVLLLVGVSALAAELVLHGWILERVLELGRSPVEPGARARVTGNVVVLAIGVAAIAEGLLASGDLAARIGAGVFGAGLGWMYVASRRSLVAPICARLAFQIGAVVLESLRLIG